MLSSSVAGTGDGIIAGGLNFPETNHRPTHPGEQNDGEAVVDLGQTVCQLLVRGVPKDSSHAEGLADRKDIYKRPLLIDCRCYFLESIKQGSAICDGFHFDR